MKIKNGVSLQGLDIAMRPVLIHAEVIWRAHGQELVITSGTETGAPNDPFIHLNEYKYPHRAGSYHLYGLALDLRTRYFSEDQKNKITISLTNALGTNYKVIKEKTHIHVQYRS